MTLRRRILPVGLTALFVLASCGGSDSSDSANSLETVPTTEAEPEPTEVFTRVEGESDGTTEATDAEAAETTASATEETAEGEGAEAAETSGATDAAATTVEDPEGASSDVVAGAASAALAEWKIDAPTEYAAGDVTFTATNNGNFPHELVVIRGDGYESLPLAEGGAVIEDELAPDALLGRTERLGGGSSADLTVTLEAGNYVLLCNLGGGSNSHAGQGQTLDITVS